MKGETIIEVVIAIGAAMIILTALTTMMLRSLNNATEGSSRTMATQYAQDGLEIMRNMKDNSWSTLVNLPTSTYCLADSCSTLSPTAGTCGKKVSTCGVNVANTFVREVAINQNDGTCMPTNPMSGKKFIRVVTSVSYKDTNCPSSNLYCHTIQVESCLTNLDSRSAP